MQLQLHQDLDLSNYQRFFAFGCSFTNFKWWTWADIIGRYFNKDDYFNLGLGASGNGNIFYRIIESHKRFKITSNDLVIVQWTNPLRETRYVNNQWLLTGNITRPNQYYNRWFIDNLIDPRGYFLETAYKISATKLIFENIGCDWDMLSLDLDDNQVRKYDDIVNVFKNDLNCIKPSFHNLLNNFKYNTRLSEHADDKKYNRGKDYHPTPLMHLEYLNKIYNLSIPTYIKDQISQSNVDALLGKMQDNVYDYIPAHRKAEREQLF